MREKIIGILKGISPSVAEYKGNSMIEDEILDSIEIMTIVSGIEDEFGITIPPDLLVPEFFESIDTLIELVKRIKKDGYC